MFFYSTRRLILPHLSLNYGRNKRDELDQLHESILLYVVFCAEIYDPINGKGDLFYPIHYLHSLIEDTIFRDDNASAVDRAITTKYLKMFIPIHYFKNIWGKISRL